MIPIVAWVLLCLAVGFAAGWIACWAAGVFQTARPQCVCPAEHVTMANCPVHGWWPKHMRSPGG